MITDSTNQKIDLVHYQLLAENLYPAKDYLVRANNWGQRIASEAPEIAAEIGLAFHHFNQALERLEELETIEEDED
ncbi:MAG: hypothetical protein F6K58_22480 [Symploca sp. SIO2E9]|nr:hypothetical protein [Symploca sp. SIO2E9]